MICVCVKSTLSVLETGGDCYVQATPAGVQTNMCELLLENNYTMAWVCNIPVRHLVT